MHIAKIIGLVAAGAAGIVGMSATAGAQQNEPAQNQVCTVTVERNQPEGVFDVTRQVFDDGSCNCFVYTGDETQPNNVEAQVANILRTQRCPNARPMPVAGPGQGASLGAGQSGVVNSLVPIAVFAGAAAGVVLLVDDDPSSP